MKPFEVMLNVSKFWMESGDVLRIQFSDGLTLLFRSNTILEYTVRQ